LEQCDYHGLMSQSRRSSPHKLETGFLALLASLMEARTVSGASQLLYES
jgi:hypothetical protein